MKTKCPDPQCPCNSTTIPATWKCLVAGIWLYSELPPGMIQAEYSHFYPDKKPAYGLKYMAKSFFSNLYHVYTFTPKTNIFDLSYFFTAKQVFIKNPKIHEPQTI